MRKLNRLRLVMHLIALLAVIGGAGLRTVNAQVQDTTAPALAEFDFNSKTIDVSAGPQTLTITLRITDDLSGFEFGNFLFISPSGQQVSSGGYNAPNRITGNSGDTLSMNLSVRIAANVPGHRSGTARLWFNDSAANSQFSTTIGGATTSNFLLNGFGLGSVAGSGPKKTIDVFVDRAVNGNPFKPFGTWSKTF